MQKYFQLECYKKNKCIAESKYLAGDLYGLPSKDIIIILKISANAKLTHLNVSIITFLKQKLHL